MKKGWKLLAVLCRRLIFLLEGVDVGLYMRIYARYLRWVGVRLDGTPKFISSSVYFDGTDYRRIQIGDNVTISREVMILTHDYSITTALASLGQRIGRGDGEKYFLKDVKIGRDCFLGARCSILPGATIGNNVIVGAGSIVTGTIPSGVIVAGNPGRIIGHTAEWAEKKARSSEMLSES